MRRYDVDELTELAAEEAPQPRAKAAKPKATMPQLDVNKRFMMLAGAAAFLTALMAVSYLNSSAAGLSAGGTKVEVYVLKEDVQRGAKLDEDRLTTAEVPKAYLAKGYFEADGDGKNLAKLKGMVAAAAMVEGEPVIEARVSPPDRKLGIAYLLKRGERAKTISVDSASGLAGLIKPGNEVDMIATIPDPSDDTRHISTPVIQKARVIAVGDHLLGEIRTEEEEAKDESGGIDSDSTVTLAVPATKIGVVTLLEGAGKLQVVLRAEGDTTVQKTAYTDDVILALVAGKVPPKHVPRPAVPHVAVPPRVYVRTVVREAPPPPRPRPVAHVAPPRPVARPVTHVAPPVSNPGNTPTVIRFGGAGENSGGN